MAATGITTSTVTVVESIRHSLLELSASDDNCSWENHRKFAGFCRRLQLVLSHFLRSPPETLSPPVQTALRGITGDLTAAAETVSVYMNRSKILVLINSKSLSASLQERSTAIGGWLSLIDSDLQNHRDLRKKSTDLSRDMKQAQFRVTDNEDRVCWALQKLGQDEQTNKSVQSAMIMDLCRALGIDLDNHTELLEQVKRLKSDLGRSSSVHERRILLSLEKIMETWPSELCASTVGLGFEFEEDACILPFKNFVCPLTKEVMREPMVVLESSQTYERAAIQYWFQRCIEDGQAPTCPVTGLVLKSLEQKPNIGLAGAIEEWFNRNIDIQINLAVEHLSVQLPSLDRTEHSLDCIYKISEEHSVSRYKFRNAGVVVLVVKLLRDCSMRIGTHLRSKALLVLLSLAKDEESKMIMLGEGVPRLAKHSLTGSSEKEREYALKLLLEFSCVDTYCSQIASEKGALVLLSSMVGDQEHPALSYLADEVLKQVEKVEDNVEHLAKAGRFEPLLNRLCGGSDDVKIQMASIIGEMTLTSSSREQIARQSAKVLVDLLSKEEAKIPSLQALYNLSILDDNAIILVDSTVLPALTQILFGKEDASPEPKELAASTIANIVLKPGHWELAPVDKKGNSMQSESTVFSLLRLLLASSGPCQLSILQILCGIASSPQASESLASHVSSRDGIKTIMPFLEHSEVEYRTYAFRLVRVLSERCQDLVDELKPLNKLPLFKDKLLDDQSTDAERSDAACILANLSISEEEVKTLLGTDVVSWVVATLRDKSWSPSSGRATELTSTMVEGLLGLLLHFTNSLDPQIHSIVQEHCLMGVFCDYLMSSSKSRVKKRAAMGLKNLSLSGRRQAAIRKPEQPPQRLCFSFQLMCWRATSSESSSCPVHNIECEEGSQFCLLKRECVKPLANLIMDDDTSVQIAAVEALSTLVEDNSKRVMDELEVAGAVDAVVALFMKARPGELQERTIWMIDRMLRDESLSQRYGQSLVGALAEALKHGNANTKMIAQDALINLKQISGINSKPFTQKRGRR